MKVSGEITIPFFLFINDQQPIVDFDGGLNNEHEKEKSESFSDKEFFNRFTYVSKETLIEETWQTFREWLHETVPLVNRTNYLTISYQNFTVDFLTVFEEQIDKVLDGVAGNKEDVEFLHVIMLDTRQVAAPFSVSNVDFIYELCSEIKENVLDDGQRKEKNFMKENDHVIIVSLNHDSSMDNVDVKRWSAASPTLSKSSRYSSLCKIFPTFEEWRVNHFPSMKFIQFNQQFSDMVSVAEEFLTSFRINNVLFRSPLDLLQTLTGNETGPTFIDTSSNNDLFLKSSQAMTELNSDIMAKHIFSKKISKSLYSNEFSLVELMDYLSDRAAESMFDDSFKLDNSSIWNEYECTLNMISRYSIHSTVLGPNNQAKHQEFLYELLQPIYTNSTFREIFSDCGENERLYRTKVQLHMLLASNVLPCMNNRFCAQYRWEDHMINDYLRSILFIIPYPDDDISQTTEEFLNRTKLQLSLKHEYQNNIFEAMTFAVVNYYDKTNMSINYEAFFTDSGELDSFTDETMLIKNYRVSDLFTLEVLNEQYDMRWIRRSDRFYYYKRLFNFRVFDYINDAVRDEETKYEYDWKFSKIMHLTKDLWRTVAVLQPDVFANDNNSMYQVVYALKFREPRIDWTSAAGTNPPDPLTMCQLYYCPPIPVIDDGKIC
ncbi:hypothetical protein SNEBB_010282 [Seison nebaliae]|nr:hypothetical protein SNEBB_010282 [Seison nebaliae]